MKPLVCIIFSFLFFMINSCTSDSSKAVTIEQPSYIEIDGKNANFFIETGYLNNDEIDSIINRVEQGIVDLQQYFGESFLRYNTSQRKLHVYIQSGEGPSHMRAGAIFLFYVKDHKCPYIHETVHALLGQNQIKWLEDGIAVFLNDYFHSDPSFPNFGVNLDRFSLKVINSENSYLLSLDNSYFSFVSGMSDKRVFERRAVYILSGSFIKYLIEKYGKDRFLKAYISFNFEESFGMKIDDLKAQWVEYLKALF